MSDSFRLAAMADPVRNPRFSRRWMGRPLSAAEIDRLADWEIGLGHHRRGEQLAHLAEQMRAEARS